MRTVGYTGRTTMLYQETMTRGMPLYIVLKLAVEIRMYSRKFNMQTFQVLVRKTITISSHSVTLIVKVANMPAHTS